ncbi:High-affinity glucose transporter [Hyphodiscus hymeniophilus]|uniref:High-affinity glucose transporter n=1 Tax=Hyphodiscus hymeniophilus TaxID=353542 RepID=A0A9P6VM61_9HELO|nr:High-affinity glucose transporter [Hyphodiscus hymeniophilus]
MVHQRKGRQFKAYNLFTVFAMSFGSLSFGYSNNIISTTLAQPTFNEYFALKTRSNGTQLTGVMNGGFHAAAFCAVLFVGTIADKWGRKVAISVGAALTLFAGAFLSGSVNVAMFIVFRLVSGAGSSILLAGVPIWMNEVVPAKERGMLVDIHGAVFQFGFALASWVGYGFYYLSNDTINAWRGPLVFENEVDRKAAFQCLPPIIILSIIYWLPESPRWLLMNDRYEEARQILLRSHSEEEAVVELAQIQAQMQIDRTLDRSYLHMFKKPSYRKRSLLAIFTCCMANCSGILVVNTNVISYQDYGPTIYASLGYDSSKQLLLSSIWSTFSVFCSFVGITFVDRISRPRLLMIGLGGCMSTLIVLAALVANFGPGTNNHNTAALKACVAMIFIYAFFWSAVLSGTQFVYCGELFPSHLRAKGLSLGVAGINAANVLFLTAAPTAFATIGWKYYLLFIILSGISIVVIGFKWPDTNGVPLEEISRLFGDDDEVYIANNESKLEHIEMETKHDLAATQGEIEHHE